MDDESVKSPAIFSLGTVQVLLSKVCGHWNYLRDHGIVLLLHAGKVLLFSSSSFFLFFLLFFSCSLVLKTSITTKSPTEIFVSHFEKMFPLRIFSVHVTKSAGLVTFTEEIPDGKLHFLCSAIKQFQTQRYSQDSRKHLRRRALKQ